MVIREPIYEGFKKTGSKISCSTCGYVFESEENLPLREKEQPKKIFDESDRPKKTELFDRDESINFCRYCHHYTVNPFTQHCIYHNKSVEATDTCAEFRKAEENQT